MGAGNVEEFAELMNAELKQIIADLGLMLHQLVPTHVMRRQVRQMARVRRSGPWIDAHHKRVFVRSLTAK